MGVWVKMEGRVITAAERVGEEQPQSDGGKDVGEVRTNVATVAAAAGEKRHIAL